MKNSRKRQVSRDLNRLLEEKKRLQEEMKKLEAEARENRRAAERLGEAEPSKNSGES